MSSTEARRARASPPWRAAGATLAILLQLAIAVNGAAMQGPGRGPPLDRATALLVRAVANRATDLETLEEELSRAGADCETLLDIAGQARVPVPLGDGSVLSLEARPEICRAIVRSLVRQPRAGILSRLEDPMLTQRRPAARLPALELAGLIGTEAEIPLLLRLFQGTPAEAETDPAARDGFESALAAIVARDAPGPARLRAILRQGGEACSLPIVRAAASGEPQSALARLAGLLGALPAVDDLVLGEIAAVAESTPPPGSTEVCSAVRAHIDSVKAEVAARAAEAAGALEDSEAVPALLAALSRTDGPVAQRAFGALRRIAGADLGRTPEPWWEWNATEQAWWILEAEDAAEDLRQGTRIEAAAALKGLGRCRLHRHAAAAMLAAALPSRGPDLQVPICQVLAQLRSSVCLPELERLSDAPEERLRDAARAATERIRATSRARPAR